MDIFLIIIELWFIYSIYRIREASINMKKYTKVTGFDLEYASTSDVAGFLVGVLVNVLLCTGIVVF